MGTLGIVFLWPFLLLAAGLVYVSFFDILFSPYRYGRGYSSGYGLLGFFGSFWWIVIIALLFVFLRKLFKTKSATPQSPAEQLQALRQVVAIASISLLIPIFVRYFLEAFDRALPVTIFCLALAFGLISWGIFSKGNKVIMFGNIVGGALALFYLYAELWSMGDLARIVAAAFGLIVAVAISVIKLKDKLV